MKSDDNKVYKIYDPATELYSAGSIYWPTWSAHGKTWNAPDLRSHLVQLFKNVAESGRIPYQGCVVIEYTRQKSSGTPVNELLKSYKKK